MYCYAQLNENDICVGVSQLSGEITSDNMIQLDSFDTNMIWKKYDRNTQQWSIEKFEPQSTAPITEFEDTKQRVADLEMAMASILGGAI